jgi:2-phospho-L-lactate transferase CofD
MVNIVQNALNRLQKHHSANEERHAHQTGIVKKSVQWLAPGLFVKRWFMVTLAGVVLIALGLAIWVRLMPVRSLVEFADNGLKNVAQVVPNRISGPIILASGFFLLFWGQLRSLKAVSGALSPQGDKTLLEMLISKRRRSRGPKIVALGGGTGLSTLLRGLKTYSANITAVVTVADDGGSSGKLRRDFGVLPPGDIRNCIAALADEEKLLTELFQYRFSAGEGLEGHSFGNLFLTAMSDITGDLEQGIAASSKVLAIQGRVLPATLCHVDLWAEMADGRTIRGESRITEADGQIVKIGCIPENPPALLLLVPAACIPA